MKFGSDDSYDSSTHGKYRPKSDMNYDGASAQVFFTCLLGLLCFGLSVWRLRRWFRQRAKSRQVQTAFCPCQGCRTRRRAKERSQRRRERFMRLASSAFWVALWALFLFQLFALYRRTRNASDSGALFDPYETLGVSRRASREDVTRAYRRRSLELHPDKNLDNPNYRPEEFVNLNKAYRVLTDPVALENYQKYGNPDGYQGTRYGIALPSWLVERGNLVLIGYALSLLFGLPIGVGLWWRRRARLISESVSQETYALFAEFLGQSTAIKFRNLPEVYGAALEFSSRTPFQAEYGDQEAISLVCQALENSGRFDHRDQRLFNRGLPHFTMNNVLLHAHLARLNWHRFPVSMKRMKRNLEILLAHMDCIIPAMVDIAGAAPRPEVMQRYQRIFSVGGYIDRVLRVVQLEQSLCQAMLPSESELMQIPWFGPSEVKVCNTNKRFGVDGIRTVAELRKHVWEPDVAALVAAQGADALLPVDLQTNSAERMNKSTKRSTTSLHPNVSPAGNKNAENACDGSLAALRLGWITTTLLDAHVHRCSAR
ncbi:secretory subunit [Cyanidiococcus yangmingshanensis]|uniref:Secretory subunit n=1 Tax=Cyanidiococcus yangmingshanensis TaxID=2690220 RepID=A0A7J7IPB4_9RHOD|nr:secretory subunit [Cyanidiococcus yangmingshanensis]